MAAETQKRDVLRSYGRKRTKRLQGLRKTRLEALLPQFRLEVPQDTPLHLDHLFDFVPQELWLEIGFGGGEHLAAQAARYPQIGFLGCEPFMDGVSKLLALIDEATLRNVRILDDDVRLLLPTLPEACLDKVFILFPDPWPKARHHKRRLVNAQLLTLLARVMKPGAILCLATDDADYAQWMLLHVLASDHFRWTANKPEDFTDLPAGWVETRYQQKAAEEGRNPCFILCERVGRYIPQDTKHHHAT